MNTWLIAVLVNNHFGVLTRVTSLFSRRGYNIAGLSVGETHDSALSRITVQTQADGAVIHQIMKQLQKLEDVKSVLLLPGAETISRELLLVKLVAPLSRREALYEAIAPYSYGVAYEDEGKLVLEMTGAPEVCEGFLATLSGYTILELCRTGITAVSTVSGIDHYS